MVARVTLEISDGDRATLEKWAKSGTTEQRLAKRARSVLMGGGGASIAEIAAGAGLTPAVVSKWRARFREMGAEGLLDAPGRGRKKAVGPEERVAILALACTEPADGSVRWSVRKLAAATGRSRALVQRVLAAGRLKPHRTHHWCGKSPDPEFAAKSAEIIGLYLSPPANALVLRVGEKSQIQALDRTQPCLPMREGSPGRLTATYRRNGTACLLAALSAHTGDVAGRCADSANGREFLRFLKHLAAGNPRREIHIVADNLSAHKCAEVKAWLASKRRVHMHCTPTRASWLNQAEIWFNIFTRDVVRGGVRPSRKALVDRIMLYIRRYNEHSARPFMWTYTGEPMVA